MSCNIRNYHVHEYDDENICAVCAADALVENSSQLRVPPRGVLLVFRSWYTVHIVIEMMFYQLLVGFLARSGIRWKREAAASVSAGQSRGCDGSL